MLRATARPFIPPQGARRDFAPAQPQPPRRDGERGGAGRRVHWLVDLVSDTWHIPRVLSDKKTRLFHTPAEIKRWREEHKSCPDYLSYVEERKSSLRAGILAVFQRQGI